MNPMRRYWFDVYDQYGYWGSQSSMPCESILQAYLEVKRDLDYAIENWWDSHHEEDDDPPEPPYYLKLDRERV